MCYAPEELDFLFDLINLNLSLNSYKWLTAAILDIIGIDSKLEDSGPNGSIFWAESEWPLNPSWWLSWYGGKTPLLSSCVTSNPEQDPESVPYLCIWDGAASLTDFWWALKLWAQKCRVYFKVPNKWRAFIH